MDTIITRPEWHTKDERPVYDPKKDNRIITCTSLCGWLNVCYDELRPDGTLISSVDFYHSEKWKKKHSIKWEDLIIEYWAWVRDIVPINIKYMKHSSHHKRPVEMNDLHKALFDLSVSFLDFSKSTSQINSSLFHLREELEELERLRKRKKVLLIRLIVLIVIFIICISYFIWHRSM